MTACQKIRAMSLQSRQNLKTYTGTIEQNAQDWKGRSLFLYLILLITHEMHLASMCLCPKQTEGIMILMFPIATDVIENLTRAALTKEMADKQKQFIFILISQYINPSLHGARIAQSTPMHLCVFLSACGNVILTQAPNPPSAQPTSLALVSPS